MKSLGPLPVKGLGGPREVCDRTGDQAKAHEHLTTATTMCREMDMSLWLEKGEADLRLPP